ncbi:MAG: Lnb N-terminal periplasmic domain-containing protein [Planctomycetota bacterium]|jgi:hypothetical protein
MTQVEETPDNDSPRAGPGLLRLPARLVLVVVAIVLALWCVGAIWFCGVDGAVGRGLAAAAFVVGFPIAWFRARRRRVVAVVFFALAGGIILAWQAVRPSNTRDWSPDMVVLPYVEFEGDLVHAHNIRYCKYVTPDDYTVDHYDKTFDLRKLETAHFMVEPFSGFEGSAHTLLTFGFEGDQFVAISVELRREKGEHFSPLAGLFKQYELMYVIGDERDLIKLRTNYRRDKVYLYPVEASREKLRELFIDMLRGADELRECPEFYNTLTSTCTTNIVAHINRIAPRTVPFSYKVLLPGYSDQLAYDLGLISTDLPLEETKRRYRIDEVAQAAGDDPQFSLLIRRLD